MVSNERLRLPLISQCLAAKIGRETGTCHGKCHPCVAESSPEIEISATVTPGVTRIFPASSGPGGEIPLKATDRADDWTGVRCTI
jgi:hypothetical protein